MTSIEWIMMGAFTAALGLSLWKLYAFLPNEPLPDDDTTEEATQRLMTLMTRCIIELFEADEPLTTQTLFERMRSHETFDRDHFWRFNPNRLNHLITRYYTLNPDASSLEHIYYIEASRSRG